MATYPHDFLDNPFLLRVFKFAKAAHESVGQVRKYTADPYIVHPLAVAQMVHDVTQGDEHYESMVAAALLHDVVEDTGTSAQVIFDRFGEDVARLVLMLTDVSLPENGNRAVRKAIDRAHIAKASPHWVFRSIVTSDSGDRDRQSGIVTTDSDDRDHVGGDGRYQAQDALYVQQCFGPASGAVRLGSGVRSRRDAGSPWGTCCPQRLALEHQAVGLWQQAIKHGIGHGRVADPGMPMLDR